MSFLNHLQFNVTTMKRVQKWTQFTELNGIVCNVNGFSTFCHNITETEKFKFIRAYDTILNAIHSHFNERNNLLLNYNSIISHSIENKFPLNSLNVNRRATKNSNFLPHDYNSAYIKYKMVINHSHVSCSS
jgi:hypothetical protein